MIYLEYLCERKREDSPNSNFILRYEMNLFIDEPTFINYKFNFNVLRLN